MGKQKSRRSTEYKVERRRAAYAESQSLNAATLVSVMIVVAIMAVTSE
jgi:hypothetical protein